MFSFAVIIVRPAHGLSGLNWLPDHESTHKRGDSTPGHVQHQDNRCIFELIALWSHINFHIIHERRNYLIDPAFRSMTKTSCLFTAILLRIFFLFLFHFVSQSLPIRRAFLCHLVSIADSAQCNRKSAICGL